MVKQKKKEPQLVSRSVLISEEMRDQFNVVAKKNHRNFSEHLRFVMHREIQSYEKKSKNQTLLE